MKLTKYKWKRNFDKTTEPEGTVNKGSAQNGIYVVQQHSASRLHFDFRMEINGVLKSWAVPKGIPIKPAEKHLAVETEDHPMEYADFEGKIPKGEYGAGTVKMWDRGRYKNIRKISMEEAYGKGQIEIKFKEGKLKGNYALINTKFNDNPKNWLIIKMRDDKFDFKNG
jgi:bifunctional non-homologous end joining protein LigD